LKKRCTKVMTMDIPTRNDKNITLKCNKVNFG